jgi:MATE family multidrug resistance protein
VATLFGLNSTLCTLVSQSFGQGNLKQCGVYLNTARVSVAIVFIPVMIALLCAENFFLAINQDRMACHYSQVYIVSMIPGLFFQSQFNAVQQMLNSINKSKISMLIYISTTILHVFWCYLFVFKTSYGVTGAGIATSITYLLNLIIASVYLRTTKNSQLRAIWASPLPDCAGHLKGYLRLGVPSTFMMAFEWWVYEILTLMAGSLSLEDFSANIIVYNFYFIAWMLPYGLGLGTAALVGNSIGKNDVRKAKLYVAISLAFSIMISIGLLLIFILGRRLIMLMYINDP